MVSFLLIVSIFCSLCSSQAPFTPSEVSQMRGYFTNNMDRSGCYTGFVCASPSNSNPDYYYHWQRDAGVSMHTLQYTDSGTSFDSYFQKYVQWVQKVQKDADSNTNVLGEPKFNCDGSAYSGGWCRPQNDGPASRAVALIGYAFYLLDNGQQSYVEQNLFKPGSNSSSSSSSSLQETCNVPDNQKVDCGHVGTTQQECLDSGCCWYEIDNNPNNYPWCYFHGGGGGGATGAIPTDLNYVANVKGSGNTCDLWEEERGVFFYTSMVQRYALYYGASLATKMGDSTTANSWINAAQSLDNTIKNFQQGNNIVEQGRSQDCSIIVGTLYGGTPDKFMPNAPKMFPPSDPVILNTMSSLKSYWSNTYQINKDDTNSGLPGTLIGRYANDAYSGCKDSGGSHGHSWILCSNAIADVWYRSSSYLYINRYNIIDEIINSKTLSIYYNILKDDFPKASKRINKYLDKVIKHEMFGMITMTDNEKIELIEYLSSLMASQGDAQLTRVAYHVKPCNYHMTEQICESGTNQGGGKEIGAFDLTWSYGTVLSAMYYRNDAIKNGVTILPLEKQKQNITRIIRDYHNPFKIPQDSCTGSSQCYNQCQD